MLNCMEHPCPNHIIQSLCAHLHVISNTLTAKAIGISANAAIIRILAFSLRGWRIDFLAIVGIVTVPAYGESLQQVTGTPIPDESPFPVLIQLVLNGLEKRLANEWRHRDFNPGITIGSLRRIRFLRCVRTMLLRTDARFELTCFRLTERRPTHVSRILLHAPYHTAIPVGFALLCGNLSLWETSTHLTDT